MFHITNTDDNVKSSLQKLIHFKIQAPENEVMQTEVFPASVLRRLPLVVQPNCTVWTLMDTSEAANSRTQLKVITDGGETTPGTRQKSKK